MSSTPSDFESDTGSFPATPSSSESSEVSENVSTAALRDARKLKKGGNNGQALAFYLIAIQTDPDLKVTRMECSNVDTAS